MGHVALAWDIKRVFKTPGKSRPKMQRHVPEVLNVQKHHREEIKTQNFSLLTAVIEVPRNVSSQWLIDVTQFRA